MKVKVLRLIITLNFFIFSFALWNPTLFPVGVADNLKWFSLIIWLFVGLFLGTRIKKFSTLSHLFLVLYFLSMVLSTINSSVINSSGFLSLIGYIVIFCICFLHKSISIHNNGEVLILDGLGNVSILVVLFSFLIAFLGSSWAGFRFTGVYANANGLASIALVSAYYCFYKFRVSRSRLWLGILLVSLVEVFISQSRGSYLAIVMSMLLYLTLERDFKNLIRLVLLSFFVLPLFTIIQLIFSEYYQVREFTIGLDNSREIMLNKYLVMFWDKPLLGHGLSISESGGRFVSELAYPDILTNAGLIGFSGFIMLQIITFFGIVKHYGSLSNELKCCFYVYFSILILSLGDGYISNIGNPLSIFVWLFIALSITKVKI